MLTHFFSSQDYLVRICLNQAKGIDFKHLDTCRRPMQGESADASQQKGRAGTTEWCGSVGEMQVSLAWDWLACADGSIQLSTAVPPRTNMRFIDHKGYELTDHEEHAAFQEIIETIPWRTTVSRQAAKTWF